MPEPLTSAQQRALDLVFDRVEDRLMDAPEGMHRWGEPASEEALHAAGLDLERGQLWARWNGLELAQDEVVVFPLEQHASVTEQAMQEGRIQAGDRVVGARGRDLYVFPSDPWEAGADVVLVDSRGHRGPLGSSAGRWILALLGEFSVLFDEDGEYREGLFDEETGEMTPATRRRLLRRRLDMDPDSPLIRFELGQALRQSGEARAAVTELRRALKLAPEFSWSHFELGRALADSDQREAAYRSFIKAAEHAANERHLAAYFWAWTAFCSDDERRASSVQEVLTRVPTFAADQEAGAREMVEDGEVMEALWAVRLARVVDPRSLTLLALERELEAAASEALMNTEPEANFETVPPGEATESYPSQSRDEQSPKRQALGAAKHSSKDERRPAQAQISRSKRTQQTRH